MCNGFTSSINDYDETNGRVYSARTFNNVLCIKTRADAELEKISPINIITPNVNAPPLMGWGGAVF